jgi:hypothetical protein
MVEIETSEMLDKDLVDRVLKSSSIEEKSMTLIKLEKNYSLKI